MYSPRTPFDSLLRPPPAALRSAAARQTGARRRGVSVRIAELVAERLLVHSGSNRSGQPMPPTWRCGTRRWCR